MKFSEAHLQAKYWRQRANAEDRGIGWELTFEEWVAWWGDDIERRGNRRDQLSMQRIADTGPYKLGNIRKGYPIDNSRTRGLMHQTKQVMRLAKELEAARDADPGTEPGPDDYIDPEEESISSYMSRDRKDSPMYWGRYDAIHRGK